MEKAITEVETIKGTRTTYIYADGAQIAKRTIKSSDATFLHITDPSGNEKRTVLIHGNGFEQPIFLDPFGADISTNPYPTSPMGSGDDGWTCEPYDEEEPLECFWEDGDWGLENNYQNEVGGVPQNLCYTNGFEADCNDVLAYAERFGDDKQEEQQDKTPSSTGPQEQWQNDDPTDNNDDTIYGDANGESFVTVRGGPSIESASNISSWDLRTTTAPEPVPMATPPSKKKPCDLAALFGDPGSYFFDNTASKDDPIMGRRPGNEHSHLYGSPTDSSVSTGAYAPKGGQLVSPTTRIPGSKFLGSSRSVFEFEGKQHVVHNANYALVQHKKLGTLTNVTLAIFHIDNFDPKVQKDGRLRLGTIGFSQADNYGSGGATGKKGGHSHYELLKGLKWNLDRKQLLSFSNICP